MSDRIDTEVVRKRARPHEQGAYYSFHARDVIAMCDEIDRLRAVLAATCDCGDYDRPLDEHDDACAYRIAHHIVGAVSPK